MTQEQTTSQEEAMSLIHGFITKNKTTFDYSKAILTEEVVDRLAEQYKQLNKEVIVNPNDEQTLFVNFWGTTAALGLRIQNQDSEALKDKATAAIFENELAFALMAAFFHDCYNPLALDTEDHPNARSAAASVLGVGGVNDTIVPPLVSTIGFIQNSVMAHHVARMNEQDFRFTSGMFADFAEYLHKVLDNEKATAFDHAVQNVVSTLCTLRNPLMPETPVFGENKLGFNQKTLGDSTIQEFKVSVCAFMGATCQLVELDTHKKDLALMDSEFYQWNGQLHFIEFKDNVLFPIFTDRSNGQKFYELGSTPYINDTERKMSAIVIPVF